MLGRPRRGLTLSLAASLIVWNVVFDRQVHVAASRYARQQRFHAMGLGQPASPMDAVMRAALTDSARAATAWAGLTLVAALTLVRSLERRRGPAG